MIDCYVGSSFSVRELPLLVASGGHSSSRCAGLSLSRPLLLRSTGSRRAGSVIVAHGPSCSAACGILPGQGSNPCPLHWQADSQPLRHQGSPEILPFATTWMDLESIMPSEIRQRKTVTLSLICGILKMKQTNVYNKTETDSQI